MSAQPPYGPPTSPPPGYRGSPPRSNQPLLIAAAVVALIVIGGLGYWLGGRDNSSGSSSSSTSAAATGSTASTASGSSAGSAAPSASGASSAAPAAGSPASSAAPPTGTTSASPSPTATPFTHPDPDFGYVKTVTTTAGVTKLAFDRATLLTGAAASSAAKAHGQTVEDDYFIVNDNPLIRTFTVSPTVVVMGSQNLSGDVGPKPSSLAALEAWVSAHQGQPLPVDLSYDAKGTVIKVVEQFFP